MATILSKGLTIKFRQTVALNDVDLDIEENEIVGIFGRSGSGKTSLLSILAALKYPSSGTIEVDGKNPFENSSITTDICFTWADQHILKKGTIETTLKFCSKLRPGWDTNYANTLLKKFGLKNKMKVNKLTSEGRSLLNIVNGLASRSPITIFDGTYTKLHDSNKNIFFNEIREDHKKHPRTIMLATDSPDEVRPLVQDVIMLDRGHVIAHAAAEEIIMTADNIMNTVEPPTLQEILMYFTKEE